MTMKNQSKWLFAVGLLSIALVVAALPVRAEEGGETEAEKAPAFTLKDVSGKEHSLSDFAGKWVVLEWTNYDCPYVKKHYHADRKNMQTLQQKYTGKDVVWLSICSSAPGKQGHMTPEVGKRRFQQVGAKATALLLDPEGQVGRAYGAKTTPDMRVIDPKGRIAYRGAIDSKASSNPGDIPQSTNYVAQVLDAVLADKEPPVRETRPYGCSVKYAR
jgi:peroxiredoxin